MKDVPTTRLGIEMVTAVALYVLESTEREFGDINIDACIGKRIFTWRHPDQEAPPNSSFFGMWDSTTFDNSAETLISAFIEKYPDSPVHEVRLQLHLFVFHNKVAIKNGRPYEHSSHYNSRRAAHQKEDESRSASLQNRP